MRVEYGGVVLMLFEERPATLQQVKELAPHQLNLAYRALTGREARQDDLEDVIWVIQGQLQIDWMNARFPEQHERIEAMATKQAKRVEKVKNPLPEDTAKKTAKKTGPTLKDLIRGMLLEGKSDDAIIAKIQAKFPDTGTASNPKPHLAFYKTQLRREGHTIEQPAKKKAAAKPAKEKSDKEFVASNA